METERGPERENNLWLKYKLGLIGLFYPLETELALGTQGKLSLGANKKALERYQVR